MLTSSPRPQARPLTLGAETPSPADPSTDTEAASPEAATARGDAAQIATRATQFDPTAPMLLGTFGTETGRAALLRLPNGLVQKVRQGDRVAGDLVVAVAPDEVTLAHAGEARRLAIP